MCTKVYVFKLTIVVLHSNRCVQLLLNFTVLDCNRSLILICLF